MTDDSCYRSWDSSSVDLLQHGSGRSLGEVSLGRDVHKKVHCVEGRELGGVNAKANLERSHLLACKVIILLGRLAFRFAGKGRGLHARVGVDVSSQHRPSELAGPNLKNKQKRQSEDRQKQTENQKQLTAATFWLDKTARMNISSSTFGEENV